MNKLLILLLVISFFKVNAQEELVLSKTAESNILFDGIVTDNEISKGKLLDLRYEIAPAYNELTNYDTSAYITYTDKFLYVGVKAKRQQVISNIVNRDDWAIYNGDLISIEIDTYTDARNQIFLLSNPSGSQLDVIRLDGNGYSGSQYNLRKSANFDYDSKGSITSDGYHLEFIIPFSEIPFPNGTDQEWNLNLRSRTFEDRTAITLSSSMANRDATCQLCLMDHKIIMKDIVIDKQLNFLPYVSGNMNGNIENSNESLKLSNSTLDYGLGLELDISKNLTFEATINPDFSQVESDVTKIDINSPTAINYPEQRPFFNKGVDAFDYEINVFNSRSINDPSFASKLINQGRKSRLYFLSAIDENSPYLVPTEFETYTGTGGKSYNNVFRYQRFVDDKTRYGVMLSNRIYEDDGYGNTIGADALVNFSNVWKFTFETFLSYNKEPIADWIDSNKTFSDYSVELDGEKFSGYSVFTEIRRETETWKSFIQYKFLSDDFRSDIGFIVKNDIKQYDLWHSFYQYPNKKYLQNYRVSLRQEQTYNSSNFLTRSSSQLYLSFLTFGDTNVLYNYEYNIKKTHLDYSFRDFINHLLTIRGKPLDYVDYNLRYKFGKDIAYREVIPSLGHETNISFDIEFTLNNNFRLKPIISYQDIKKINSDEYFFKGYIGRLDLRYQFNNTLDIRLIGEYNDFSDELFFQPLVSWRPDPDTIFYLGGNQNYIKDFPDYNSPIYMANQSQIFLKFQYLIKS
tara:strand:+ start:551 stop:2779 length:2229 start_codon:yes stop_codon:yes gene_type:complete